MEENHKLALYVSYYLSRFDKVALKNLGYMTWNEAFNDISLKLNVKEHSVKNWRDEFDPLHGHRAGWHQRPMSPSRVKVAKALEDLTQGEIKGLVLDILSGTIHQEPDNLSQLTDLISDTTSISGNFILRAPTGRMAEEYFIKYFDQTSQPVQGQLIDTRDLGCGYDFEIKTDLTSYFIEVKGLATKDGGILFTNKEWEKAKEKGDEYIVVLIANLKDNASIKFIVNPFRKLKPKRNIVTSIQVQWSVSQNQLKSE